ncbi:MAG TPA: SET domain-containing protein, partial [Kofleriaceae bacterium]|nr:SET domain-containing protein [Kofleriaceae bacterium]
MRVGGHAGHAGEAYELALEAAPFDAEGWEPLPVRAATPPADAVAALLAWAAREGARFDAIELVVGADGNRTVHARRALAAGEPIVTVPRALMIDEDDVDRDEQVAAVGRVEGTMVSPPCALGVWLAREAARATSPWRAYLDALPAAFPWMALHRQAAELASLDGTRALAMIAYRARGLRADHELLGRRTDAVTGLGLAAYTWGQLVSGSRCFRIDTRRGSRRALVPVADMFDHGRADATWAYLDGERFEVRAARDLAAGQEIQLSYGRSGNAT